MTLDPLPVVEVRANGGPPKKIILDTGATTLGLTVPAAEVAGLKAVSSMKVMDAPRPGLPDGTPTDGALGTVLFCHFLTTMDYVGRALILRRKTGEQLRRFRAWIWHRIANIQTEVDVKLPRVATRDRDGFWLWLSTSN
ncbi:hypothetical protein ACWDA3_32460 [Nonomuraea rubra]